MNTDTRLRGIYAIVNDGPRNPVDHVAALLDGGVRIFQYRAKNGIVAANVRAIVDLARARDALVLLNDDWEAAVRFDADGAHLGPDDATRADLPAIRERLRGRLLGLSCGTEEEARFAQACGADYIGIGAVYATNSKADAGSPIGIAGLSRVAAACSLPAAAIGGISFENLAHVRASGVAMAALISALNESDPAAAARRLVAAWGES